MEDEIDLKSILKMFWDRKIGIAIVVLVCTLIGFVYTIYFVEPVYTAESTAVLTSGSDSDNSSTVMATDLTINDKLVSTYSEIATSDTVVSTVISNLGLNNISVSTLKKQITVSAKKNAQVISLLVENEDPNVAAKIANELRTVFSDKASEIYKIDNIQPLDDAKVPTTPSNINHTKDIVIFCAIGIILGIAYAVIANILDNTVKTVKDIEQATGLNVIAEIPLYDFNKGRRK